ncbi:MAG: UDP-N-acetylmuramoyl-tripeptide--D-alanyl-D-alanine ligase [Phycisphaerales bacterium]
MSFWEFESVRLAMRARWLRPPAERPERPPMGASIDTRTLEAGQVFFALRGERVDGHQYLGQAAAAGASIAVVEDRDCALEGAGGMAVALVADGREALTRLAGAFRAASPTLKVVGVTGSNGKTTTTRLIHAALGTELRGTASRKSFNNQLGLPLTLLGARPGDQFVVCEMGTSSPGEIAALARVARPDVAVITSIGRAHLQELGSVEGVAREKASILEYAAENGVGVIPAGCAELERAVAGIKTLRVVRVGPGEGADVRWGAVRSGKTGVSFEVNGRERFRVRLMGAHNAHNGAVAVAVARRFGLSDESIRRGLGSAAGVEGRLERVTIESKRGAVVVIDDAYNANPESMRAALAALIATRMPAGGRRVAVLGDRLEWGAGGAAAHAEIAEMVRSSRSIHAAVLVGAAMSRGGRGGGGEGAGVRVERGGGGDREDDPPGGRGADQGVAGDEARASA